MSKAFTTGALAHWDTLTGAVPCRVEDVEVRREGNFNALVATIHITASRGPYRRGEVLKRIPCRHLIPRGYMHVRKYGAVIYPGYRWTLPECIEG